MSQLQALRRLFGYAGEGGRFVVAGCCMILVDALAQMLAPAVFGIVLDRVQANPRSFLQDGWQRPLLAILSALVFLASAYTAHTWARRLATPVGKQPATRAVRTRPATVE
jgi:ABC-type multidrug transport system fused ATPase/permease subunit